VHLFCTKALFAAFLLLQFGFEFFWQKNIGTKAAYKMLMKLTTEVKRKNNIAKVSFQTYVQVHRKNINHLRGPGPTLDLSRVPDILNTAFQGVQNHFKGTAFLQSKKERLSITVMSRAFS